MTPKIAIHKIIGSSLAITLLSAIAFLPSTIAQTAQSPQSAAQDSMAGMDMSQMQPGTDKNDAATAATSSMSDDMDMRGANMDAHMHLTDLRPANAADAKRAAEILAQLRPAIEKYKDYHVALADNFRIFGPNVPQDVYHFTNYRNSIAASFKFDPARPSSLLYKKTADGYELVGVMYTDRRGASLDDLNARVPLSVARWHVHVNLCLPPRGQALHADFKQFGPNGSIANESACDAAGGRWYPQIFGWMVHVYPFQSDPGKIWAH